VNSRRLWLVLVALVGVVGAAAALRLDRPVGSRSEAPPAATVAEAPDSVTAPHRVVAYYFHTNYRCSSCRKIEATARHAIEIGFPTELADGRLVWRVINVEEDGNEHFIKDYQLYTKSVVLSDQQSGRQVRWKNLAKVWELLNDEAGFVDYVQTETRAYLDDAP